MNNMATALVATALVVHSQSWQFSSYDFELASQAFVMAVFAGQGVQTSVWPTVAVSISQKPCISGPEKQSRRRYHLMLGKKAPEDSSGLPLRSPTQKQTLAIHDS